MTRFPPFGRAAIVVQVAAALGFLAFLVARGEIELPFGGGGYEVKVVLTDASGLRSSDTPPVTVAGVPSGRVESVDYVNGRAVARLHLDEATRGKIHTDTRATVAPRSALNDLTLDLSPGTTGAPALRPGATIPASHAAGAVALDSVLRTLDADTRASLQILLGQLDRGLRGRSGPVAAALRRLEPAVASTTDVAHALATRRALLARLVQNMDRVFGALGRRGHDLQTAIEAGSATLAVTARRDRELAATLRRAPATLDALTSALRATRTLGAPLDPALTRLRPAVRALPATLRSLRATVPAARGLLTDVAALARDGGAPTRDLRGVAEQLGPTASGLRTPVGRLRPIVNAIDRDKEGIGLLGDRFSGVFSTNDANGPILRGLGFFEAFAPEHFGFPAGLSGAHLEAAKLDVVRALTRVCLRTNPLACVVRYLVPGLPGAVRSATAPLGSPAASALSTLPELLSPEKARAAGLVPAPR